MNVSNAFGIFSKEAPEVHKAWIIPADTSR